MPTVAEQLRSAREIKNMTIYQVAETTKIRTDHIRALEEGNFEVFSAPVYIRGSVKNYAMLLKLDVPVIMAALNVELGQTEKFKEPPKLMEESNTPLDHVMFLLSKLNWRAGFIGGATLVVLLIIFLIGMAWRHHSHKDSLAGVQPAVYQSSGSSETLPLPTHH
jgi:cytoskeletal protein RodZ